MNYTIERMVCVACLVGLPSLASANGDLIAAQSQRLTADVPVPNGFFATKIAIDGDLMVVGTRESAAYVFEHSQDQWQQVARLSVSPGAGFGSAVALDAASETVVVGGGAFVGGDLLATAWIFERIGGVWTQMQRVSVPDSDAFFGGAVSVAISGDRLAVGGPLDLDLSDRGQVDVFGRTMGTWNFECRLEPQFPQDEDFFGWSVDMDGTTVVVGAYGDDGAATQTGAAYVFDLDVSCSTPQRLSDMTSPSNSLAFGWSVAVDGPRIAVGARFDTTHGSMGGAVVAYENMGGNWTEVDKLTPAGAQAGDWFGFDVDLDGDRLVVGANLDDAALVGEGSVYLYSWDGAGWCEEQRVNAADGQVSGRFGEAVGIDGGRFVAGTFGAGSPAASGVAYAFEFGSEQGSPYCQGGINSIGLAAGITSFGSALVADDDFHLLATDAPPNRFGLFFYGPNQVQVPLDNGFRCVGGMTQRLYPILRTDPAGALQRRISLSSEPGLSTIGNAAPITMNFQLWYRDGGSSNLTDGVEVSFQ